MKNCVVRRTERVRLTRQLSSAGSVACGVYVGQNEVMRDWRYHRQKIMIQQERGRFMGGILGACNAISDYLHTLNMGSTLFRLILAMFLGCLIGIDRGMKKRVAGVKTHMIVCMGATLVMMTGDFIHVYSNGAGIGDTARLGAQVVSGIGFLGVGTIIVTGQRHVSGLTTAASLWTSACIGLAVGIGFYSGAIFTTLGLILVFKYAKYIEVYVEEHSNTYDVYMEFENEDKMSMVIKKLREEDILISNVVIIKKRSKTQSVVIQATMEAAKWKARHTVYRDVIQQEGVISVEEI